MTTFPRRLIDVEEFSIVTTICCGNHPKTSGQLITGLQTITEVSSVYRHILSLSSAELRSFAYKIQSCRVVI